MRIEKSPGAGQDGATKAKRNDMQAKAVAPQLVPLTEHTLADLFDQAVDLAYIRFGKEVTDEHVEAVCDRLALNWQWGLDAAGAVTVH